MDGCKAVLRIPDTAIKERKKEKSQKRKKERKKEKEREKERKNRSFTLIFLVIKHLGNRNRIGKAIFSNSTFYAIHFNSLNSIFESNNFRKTSMAYIRFHKYEEHSSDHWYEMLYKNMQTSCNKGISKNISGIFRQTFLCYSLLFFLMFNVFIWSLHV